MKNGTTKTGFEYSYDPATLDDMYFVDVLAELFDESTSGFDALKCSSKLLGMMLGKDQKDRLYKHIAETHNGRVPGEALIAELNEILGVEEEPGKN